MIGTRPSWVLAFVIVVAAACGEGASSNGETTSDQATRRARRAFDGAPPTVPHERFGNPCSECHNEEGKSVENVGFAPPSPHGETAGFGAARCEQCHVFRKEEAEFRASNFEGFRRPSMTGARQHGLAPPVMPHPRFMRENCAACHSGKAAREEIRCTHPERVNCSQCHVEKTANDLFPGKR